MPTHRTPSRTSFDHNLNYERTSGGRNRTRSEDSINAHNPNVHIHLHYDKHPYIDHYKRDRERLKVGFLDYSLDGMGGGKLPSEVKSTSIHRRGPDFAKNSESSSIFSKFRRDSRVRRKQEKYSKLDSAIANKRSKEKKQSKQDSSRKERYSDPKLSTERRGRTLSKELVPPSNVKSEKKHSKTEPDLSTARRSPPPETFETEEPILQSPRMFESSPSKNTLDSDKLRNIITKHSQSRSASKEDIFDREDYTTPHSSWSESENFLSTSPSSMFSNSPSGLSALAGGGSTRRKSSSKRPTSLEAIEEHHQLGTVGSFLSSSHIPPTQEKPDVTTTLLKLGTFSIPEKNIRSLTLDLYNELLLQGFNNEAKSICLKYHSRNRVSF